MRTTLGGDSRSLIDASQMKNLVLSGPFRIVQDVKFANAVTVARLRKNTQTNTQTDRQTVSGIEEKKLEIIKYL